MPKSKGLYKVLYAIFVILVIAFISYGIYFFTNNIDSEKHTFTSDGYVLKLSNNNNAPTTYTFNNGSEYNYKKFNDKIGINSNEEGNVRIDKDSMVHYANDSILTLKNIVGIDVNNIDDDIIFYYNIYKNTTINKNNEGYYINTIDDKSIKFEDLLIRIDTNKFLLACDNIRLVLSNDNIIDFNKYVYFEYSDGSIVKIYNNQKYYQTISSDAKLVSGDITIDLEKELVFKGGVAYITLTNLVIDSSGNIDIITENISSEINLANPNPAQPITPAQNDTGSDVNIVDSGSDETTVEEEIVDEDSNKLPEFKVVEMTLTSLKLDARIEVIDTNSLLVGESTIMIVENATYKTVYETKTLDSNIMISLASLNPDTEYTLIAKANYQLDEIEYNKTFLSKIFRTSSLGVSINSNYSASDRVSVIVRKEVYSTVTSVNVSILESDGSLTGTSRQLSLRQPGEYEVVFDELSSNRDYIILMDTILSEGVVVEEGYYQNLSVKTLKKAPTIGSLNYVVDKKNATFTLKTSSVIDDDNGIVGYRYEIYDTRNALSTSLPVSTIEKSSLSDVVVNVSGKLERWVPYTYKLIVIFYDNEKTIEYSRDLGTTMHLDGVEYPSLRFQEVYVTHEQINGVIVIDDPNGAIINNEMLVIYKNSVDIYDEDSYTISDVNTTTYFPDNSTRMDVPAGTIPVNVNNLRKNETYTFQVFGYINLQDGNDDLEMVYIGSVFVQTNIARTLTASYTEDKEDLTTAFSINIHLSNESAEHEAKTLNEMRISLYEGNTTDGNQVTSIHIVDGNSDPYISTIKRDYYDSVVNITPDFFSLNNTDFSLNNYTLVISDARDYTRYGNEIPIDNNVFHFEINDYVGEYDGDPNDSVYITEILNKNASAFNLTSSNDLDSNTVIGYSIAAAYNNQARNAKYVIYHVWVYDYENNRYVKLDNLDRRIDFNTSGSLPRTIFEVDSGTSTVSADMDPNDTKLRRGNKYYFTYEVYLDTNNDGNINVVYPNDVEENLTLRSTYITCSKQKSTITMYPSSSTSTTATWKYKINDVDHALANSKLYSYVGAKTAYTTNNYSSDPTIEVTNTYSTVTFSGLSANNSYGIKKADILIKGQEAQYTLLNEQWHFAKLDNLGLSYRVEEGMNRFVISINDYYNNLDLASKIVYVDVTFSSVNSSSNISPKTFSKLRFNDGVIYIDYYDLEEFVNVNMNVEVSAYFDSGEYGYDVSTTYKAIQKVSIEENSNYYSLSGSELTQGSNIINSFFNLSLNPNTYTLSITEPRALNIDVAINEAGVLYRSNYIVAKALKNEVMQSTTSSVKFESVVAGISLMDGNKYSISALLTSVVIKADIITSLSPPIKDDKVYVELYKTDENGNNAVKLSPDKNYPVSSFVNPITIDNLTPETNYFIKFYVIVEDTLEKVYMYDIDSHEQGMSYRFYTLSEVGISNISLVFSNMTYFNKSLVLAYNLDIISGFDRIAYELYLWNGYSYVNSGFVLEDSTRFYPQMSYTIPTPPGNNPAVYWGQRYKVVIKAYGTYDLPGGSREIMVGSAEENITLSTFTEPYIGISSGRTTDSIYFKVSVRDSNHLFVNDSYNVELLDSLGNTIAQINNNLTDEKSKEFRFDQSEYNLVNGQQYKLVVEGYADKFNSNDPADYTEYSKTRIINFGDAVSIGTVTASASSVNDKYITIIFADSYKLTDVTDVAYFVSDAVSGEYVTYDMDSTFSTGGLSYNAANNYYYYTIDCSNADNFVEDNTYIITLNFFKNGTLVDQAELNYYYGG